MPVPIRLLAREAGTGALFTRLMRDLFVALGYDASSLLLNLRRSGREIDVSGRHRQESRRLRAECKAESRPIGGPDVNKFLGVLTREQKASRPGAPPISAYFVSLSGFRSEALAQEDAEPLLTPLDGGQIVEELRAGKVLAPAEVVLAQAGAAVPAGGRLVPDAPELLGHESGWFWAVPFRRRGERTHVALVQGNGEALAPRLARHLLALDRDLGGELHALSYLPPPADPEPVPPSARALAAAERRYRQFLVDRYQYLQLKGMGVEDRLAVRLPLLDLFVPLTVRVGSPRGDTWERLRIAGRALIEEEKRGLAGEARSVRLPVLDLLRRHPGVVIKGDPGAGKTTLLKYLALRFALKQTRGLRLGRRLPVLLPLAACAGEVGRISFVELFDRYCQREIGGGHPFGALLERELAQGRVLLLFDGLDEVRDEGERRGLVRELEGFWSAHHRAGNRFLLTSRLVGYVRPVAQGLVEATLLDLEEDDISSFVEKWTARIEVLAAGDNPESHKRAAREREDLLRAIRGNEGIRQLATNPLMLTLLALMKRQGVELPERRVELYKKYVETLLRHWHLERSLAPQALRSLPPADDKLTLRRLATLALWMQEASPGRGLVEERLMRRELRRILAEDGEADPDAAVEEFLQAVRLDSSLLLERGHRQYGFFHLSFQEYLAAVALARRIWKGPEAVVRELSRHLGERDWHEVILLTIGHLVIDQGLAEAAGEILESLMAEEGAAPGVAVVLAGQALLDAGADPLVKIDRPRLVERLVETLRDDARVEAPRRVEAGRLLAGLGDPRPEATTLAGLAAALVTVPAGRFVMGSGKDDRWALESEKPRHEVELRYAYRIARFPVTVGQYLEYLGRSGRDARDNPHLSGWRNAPLQGVSWEEAMDFCRWLTAAWREEGRIGVGEVVTLPSEAEWERAARGTEGRIFPWGDEPDPNRANYDETGIGGVSPVGCFPGGRAESGCEEMAGNVWEWTRSLWRGYPYDPKDGREEVQEGGTAPRVARGGSFTIILHAARSAVRLSGNLSLRNGVVGFRPVVLPATRGIITGSSSGLASRRVGVGRTLS